jgi:hypothetical protein
MYSLSNYEAQQELNYFNKLIYSKEVLSKEEYYFCVSYDKSSLDCLHVIYYNNTNDYALNLNVYSESEHHEKELRMERGE